MARSTRLIFQDALIPGAFEGEFGHHHWHLVLLLSGEMGHVRGDDVIRFAPGDLRLSRPNSRHRLRFGAAGARCAVMLLPRSWIPAAMKAHFVGVDSIFGRDEALLRLTDTSRADFSADDIIQREFGVRELVASLARPLSGRSASPAADWLLNARAALYEGQESVAEVAMQARVSPEHLSREFVGRFGFKPVEFRLAARTRMAVELLKGTQAGLADIAYETGFASQSHMTNAVRRWTRRTPLQWRAPARPA